MKNASVRLREGGAASIGVADLMKGSRSVHGGFAAHALRDALIGEAAHAMDQTVVLTGAWACGGGTGGQGARIDRDPLPDLAAPRRCRKRLRAAILGGQRFFVRIPRRARPLPRSWRR